MKILQYLPLVLLFGLASSCELTEVENPNVSQDKYIDSPQAADSWVNGTRRELSQATNTLIEFSELVSDNYFNNRTLSSKVFDIPQIDFFDIDVNRVQAAFHELRTTAQFGLNEVLPNDPESTDEDEAFLQFALGVAYVYSGVYTVGLPTESLGQVRDSDALLQLAIDAFEAARNLTQDADLDLAARLGQARAYYRLGDRTNAQSAVQEVINANPLLNYQVTFDGVNGLNNQFQFYLYDSSNDEFAPLPRLDFLDPKFYNTGNPSLEQQPVSLFKAEEAYLILAEAQIAGGDLPAARTTLNNLLSEVVAQRPVVTFDDSRENRGGGNRTDYPLTDDVAVKFSEDAPERDGFILDRQAGPVSIPVVSGTSVDADQIAGAGTEDELLEIVYLMRQEIFIAEGRRMADLGIKWPVSENESLYNDNVGDAVLQAQIPDFIPGDFGMDDFTYDEANGVVTMRFNMNAILVANKTSDLVLPFH